MNKLKEFLVGAKSLLKNFIRLDKFFWKDLKKYIITIYIIVFIDVIFNFIARGSQALIINSLTEIAGGKIIEQKTIIILAVVLIASLIIPSFINIVKFFYKLVIWRKIEEKVSLTFIRKKASFDLSQLENSEIFSLGLRIQANMFRFRNYFYTQFDIFDYIFSISTIIITLIFIKPLIALIIIVFTIPEIISKLSLSKHVWVIDNLNTPIKKKYNYLKQIFFEQGSIMEIKLSGNIDFFINKLIAIIDPFLIEQYDNDKKRSISGALTVFVSKIGIILSAFILIYAVYNKEMQIGTFVFLYSLITSFQSYLSSFFGFVAQQYEDNLYVDEYFQLLDMDNEMKFSTNPVFLPTKKTPLIEFKNVSFKYPDNKKETLHNINFKINPGEKIAIVGVNGAGKSSLIKLLTRFYDVSSGEIYIAGNNIKDVDLDSWWKIIGYMPQDAKQYFFEVRQSIAMSDTTKRIDMKKVEKAATMSLAKEFIDKFKNGYHQQLGKHFKDGEALSGGQLQRINLARVFYKEPQVYILDEPTSAMDADAEAKIFDTLANLPNDKTVIFISHRFSTIRQADRICLLEDGKILELGTHDELIKNNKTYKKLFELQAKGYE